MYCKHCSKEVNEGSVFCNHCGKKQDYGILKKKNIFNRIKDTIKKDKSILFSIGAVFVILIIVVYSVFKTDTENLDIVYNAIFEHKYDFINADKITVKSAEICKHDELLYVFVNLRLQGSLGISINYEYIIEDDVILNTNETYYGIKEEIKQLSLQLRNMGTCNEKLSNEELDKLNKMLNE